jgi:hypothetical protein
LDKPPFNLDEMNMVPPMDFDVIDPEPWVRCKLPDGTMIKVRTIVIGIKRLPHKNPDGTNAYVIQTNTQVRVTETTLKLNK